MAHLREIFVVLIASVYLSEKIRNVQGFASNRGIQDFSTIDGKPEKIFPPNGTSSRDKEGLGYLCDTKTCLSLCCPPGKFQMDENCVEDNATTWTWPRIRTSVTIEDTTEEELGNDFYLSVDDPCSIDWMTSSVSRNFSVLPNGLIFALDSKHGLFFDSEHHCLFRPPKSEIYLAKVCRPWIVKVHWQIACLLFNCIVMLIVFIFYGVVPEFRNLHGRVFRSYVGTYILTHFALMGQQLTVGTRGYPGLFTFFVFTLHYLAGCCALWLNVMSFNIWRTFRGLRSVESNTKEHDRRKFISYAIYAWVTPGVINMTTMLVMIYVPYFHNLSLSENLILWTCAALLTTVVVCNGILFASTAIRIRQFKKDTAHLAKGVNKHHEAETRMFNLHVKLFMITGTHTIMWVIWELWPIEINTHLMIILEVVQSILIFIIFTWKDNVKRSLRKRFDDTMCRLQSTFGTSHVSATTKS